MESFGTREIKVGRRSSRLSCTFVGNKKCQGKRISAECGKKKKGEREKKVVVLARAKGAAALRLLLLVLLVLL